jgi:hypothetical protein
MSHDTTDVIHYKLRQFQVLNIVYFVIAHQLHVAKSVKLRDSELRIRKTICDDFQ